MIQVLSLSHEDAYNVVNAIKTELEQRNKGAAIAVTDAHGELLAFFRTDGCKLPSITIAINKAHTAAREQRPSLEVGQSSHEKGWPMTNFGNLNYVSWGGGIPVKKEAKVVGAIGVSGLSEEEDIALAELGLKALGL
ncbi:MAG: heme-binding protein [Trueperaceae bacterium]|nr:heme-binding protein [Trueperaceae bacterium]